jgi:hypothetical protein
MSLLYTIGVQISSPLGINLKTGVIIHSSYIKYGVIGPNPNENIKNKYIYLFHSSSLQIDLFLHFPLVYD